MQRCVQAERPYLGGEAGQCLAAVRQHLAPQQVEGLDAIGAFIDLRDAHITYSLLLAPFANVAVATVHLLAEHAAFQAVVGEERLGHRGQQRHHALGLLAFTASFGIARQVELLAHIGGKRPAPFGEGAHGQQHAPHIAVVDDRVGGFVPQLRAHGGAALQALVGVAGSRLVRRLGTADALDADRQAFIVHHGEHGRQALVRGAHQITRGCVEIHHAGGRRLDTHLVFDRAAVGSIALAQPAIGVNQELGHQEQRDALGTGGRIGQLGQHQVDDVLGQVLLAAGDEDLAAGDAVAAVGLGFGAAADQPQVGAGMRLGQAHGAGPAALVQGRQVSGLERLAGVRIDRQATASAQRRIQAEAAVGRVEHLFEQHPQHLRHAHAAIGRVAAQADPAALAVGVPRFAEAIGRRDAAGVETHALLVTLAAERGDQLAADLGRFFQNGVGGVGVYVLGQGRQARPQGRGVEYIVQYEAHVAQGGSVGGHWRLWKNGTSGLALRG